MQHLSFFPFFLVAGLVLACCSFLGYLPTVTIRQAFSMRSSESRPTQGPSFAQDESAVPSRSLMYQHTMRRTRSHHDLGIAMPELGTIARPTAAGLRGLRNSLDPPSDCFLQSVCPILGITLAQFFSINKFATNPVLSLLRNRGLPWGQTAAAFQTITTGSAAQFYISQGFPIGNDGHGIYAALEHFETQAIRENLVSGIVGGLSYPTTAGRHAIALQWVKNSKKVRVRELQMDCPLSAGAIVDILRGLVESERMNPSRVCYIWYCTNTSALRRHIQDLLRQDPWRPQPIPARHPIG